MLKSYETIRTPVETEFLRETLEITQNLTILGESDDMAIEDLVNDSELDHTSIFDATSSDEDLEDDFYDEDDDEDIF